MNSNNMILKELQLIDPVLYSNVGMIKTNSTVHGWIHGNDRMFNYTQNFTQSIAMSAGMPDPQVQYTKQIKTRIRNIARDIDYAIKNNDPTDDPNKPIVPSMMKGLPKFGRITNLAFLRDLNVEELSAEGDAKKAIVSVELTYEWDYNFRPLWEAKYSHMSWEDFFKMAQVMGEMDILEAS